MAATASQFANQSCQSFHCANNTKNEFDLIVACCADLSPAERETRIRKICGHPLDYAALVELADEHSVVFQVFSSLQSNSSIPQETRAALSRRAEAAARRSLWLTSELLRVLSRLESNGIDVLPYKGPALAQALYGDVASRQFSDLDLLVRPADIDRALLVLRDMGYTSATKLSAAQRRAYLNSGYEYVLDSAPGKNLIELQWSLLPRFYAVNFELEELFQQAVPLRLMDRNVQSLSAQHLVLVLCLHAAKHAWVQLSWLWEIGRLMQSADVCWDKVQRQAHRLGIQRIIATSCLLVHRLLAVPLPEPMRTQIEADSRVEALAIRVVARMSESQTMDPESIDYFQLMLLTRERIRDRVRFLWRLAATPGISEWTTIRLPAPLSPFYRLVRVGRLGRRALGL